LPVSRDSSYRVKKLGVASRSNGAHLTPLTYEQNSHHSRDDHARRFGLRVSIGDGFEAACPYQ
jgi:hypothetical protein